MAESRYGGVGWREFAGNRDAILAKYDLAKVQGASRPVKVNHGPAGEAALREWLKAFLPKKYGVTSGFIIPDIVATEGYKIYHYDVIIFDALNAPVLWAEGNPDQADQGKKRAIPARYVYSVIEVKATFGADPAKAALQKLRELSELTSHLPPHFFCQVLFMELPIDLAPQGRLLGYLLPKPPIPAFRGGLVMRCGVNASMSGVIELQTIDDPTARHSSPDEPLMVDVDALDIHLNAAGGLSLPHGASVALSADGISRIRVRKTYTIQICEGETCASLAWSINGFSQFALDMLLYLEGTDHRQKGYSFGQVYDWIEQRS